MADDKVTVTVKDCEGEKVYTGSFIALAVCTGKINGLAEYDTHFGTYDTKYEAEEMLNALSVIVKSFKNDIELFAGKDNEIKHKSDLAQRLYNLSLELQREVIIYHMRNAYWFKGVEKHELTSKDFYEMFYGTGNEGDNGEKA